ncbi:hypothetical protein T11_5519 [Trichinella zimbabwensis]|uniref:Uncharacterized protein n=1 Tax=Trichinella zimbabwensis TaxID=268475 RepID=A0A0V1GP71_9BILA|nr:hypothetical protein T11_5519 [Trichinella zimbabwensis]
MSSASSFCHRPTGLAESNAIAATWTSEESSPDPHCLQARRDSASAFWCFFPGRWTTSKSNSASFSNQRATCPSGSRKFCNHFRELWSVRAVNFLPYRYGRKCHVAQTRANISLRVAQ